MFINDPVPRLRWWFYVPEEAKDVHKDDDLIDFRKVNAKLKERLGQLFKKPASGPEQLKPEQHYQEQRQPGLLKQEQPAIYSPSNPSNSPNSGPAIFNKEGELKTNHSSPSVHSSPKPDDHISLDFKELKKEFKKHARWLIPVLCIIIAMSFSIYFRTMPQRLPIVENWAENAIQDFYSKQIEQKFSQEYPHLPQQNLDILVNQEWQKFKKENEQLLTSQSSQLEEQYRSIFKDEEGTTYLLGIDPYYYYRQTEYVLNNGFPGTSVKDGLLWDDYRLAPLGREAEWNFHHWFGALWHRFLNLFGDFSLKFTFFYVGTIFSALTVIPGFFIGRRITNNNAGGFFVAMLLAVSSFFVSRTTGESSDTDVYAVFFPVLIAWLFLEALDASAKKKKLIWASLAGLMTGLFAFAWTGWWYIATFIVATLLLNLFYKLVLICWEHKTLKKLSSLLLSVAKSSELVSQLQVLGVYILSGSLSVSWFTSFNQFLRVISGPFSFLQLKAVAVYSYWPNIRTTVAELNVTSFSHVLEQLGGKWFLIMGIMVILILLFRKDKNGQRQFKQELYLPLFLAIWLISSLFATTKGVRFILQATPIFAIAVGSFWGLLFWYVSGWVPRELKLNKMATRIIVFALLCLLLIQPIKAGYVQAFNSVSSMNDGWYSALSKIKNEAPKNIVITSWWDFGHWFKAVADRPVTFDGGTQTPWGAYWVGRSLLTSDEKLSVGIIRMLNCGQNNAFKELDSILQDTPQSIDILNLVVTEGRDSAAGILRTAGLTSQQAEMVLKNTHCQNPLEDYYITSADMVGKAGVWGHFGSWNFNRAVQHKETRNLPREQAVQYLATNFNFSLEEAGKVQAEIISNDADRWIAPWPGFLTGIAGCNKADEETIHCSTSFQNRQITVVIGLNSLSAKLGNTNVTPNSLIYVTPDDVIEQTFEGERIGFSVVLIPDGNNGYNFLLADPLQAPGMFTRLFFLEGHGLNCFSKFDDRRQFDNQRIITWKVDYDCQQKNKAFFN